MTGKKVNELSEELISRKSDAALKAHYGSFLKDKALESVRNRILDLLSSFSDQFGQDREVSVFSGPGRTELAGNHTDHQLGNVICASVDLDILAAVSANNEGIIRIYSQGFEPLELDLKDPEVFCENSALAAGVADYLKKEGYVLGGFDAVFHSQIPAGSGLSSSAAYENLVGQILNELYNDSRIERLVLAKAGQYAENTCFHKPSGLMDQMASAYGGVSAIDFGHPDKPLVKGLSLDVDQEGYVLCIINTGSSHADLSGDYASIPQEMETIARFFGKKHLSKLNRQQILDHLPELRKQAGDRAVLRALHFFDENERVKKQGEALNANDFASYLKLVKESGNSSLQQLQNIWTAQNPRQQALNLALALGSRLLEDKGAIRVHGGGFGGTIQAYVPLSFIGRFTDEMEKVFGKGSCFIVHIRNQGAGRLIP